MTSIPSSDLGDVLLQHAPFSQQKKEDDFSYNKHNTPYVTLISETIIKPETRHPEPDWRYLAERAMLPMCRLLVEALGLQKILVPCSTTSKREPHTKP